MKAEGKFPMNKNRTTTTRITPMIRFVVTVEKVFLTREAWL